MQKTNCKHCGAGGKLRQQSRGFEIELSFVCSDCWAMYVNGIWQAPKAKTCKRCGKIVNHLNQTYGCSCSKNPKRPCPICGKDLFLFIDRKECVEYDTLDEPGEPFRIEITGEWLCPEFCHDYPAFEFESQTFKLALTVEDLERLHRDNL